MKKTTIPTIAGTLNILVGTLNLSAAFLFFIGMRFIRGMIDLPILPYWIPYNGLTILPVLSWLFLIGAFFAITGGVCAVRRKKWMLAATGSITAFFPLCIPGLISLTLLTISKDEFETPYQQKLITSVQENNKPLHTKVEYGG